MVTALDPMPLSAADEAYVRASFVSLDLLCLSHDRDPTQVRRLIAEELLPRPSYVLSDGTEMVPSSYLDALREVDAPDRLPWLFRRRFAAAARNEGLSVTSDDIDVEWRHHLSGVYGVCLRIPSPEHIARKRALVDRIEGLLRAPTPEDDRWRTELQHTTDALDALEREFSPDYDRHERFDGTISRERLIEAPRATFLDQAL